MLGLGALPYGITSWAYGTNYDGSVVVGMSYYGTPSDVDYAYQAFAWNAGTMTGLPFLSGLTGAESEANAVSSNGAVVVGWSQSSEGATTPGDRLEAFRWSGGTIMGLGYLPGGYRSVATATNADGSIVVGWGNDATDHTEAFLWTTTAGITGLGFLSGGNTSQATAINADGSVVVGYGTDSGGLTEAFLWTTAAGMVGLGFLAGTTESEAYAVNADGSVIVGGDGSAHTPVRWAAATGIQSIPAILAADGIDLSGWSLTAATGVSSDGTTIVGNGINPAGYTEGWIAHIPVNAFALLDLHGEDHSIGSLVWGGLVTNSGASFAALTIGSDNTDASFKGTIQDGTSATALIKVGTGTQTLTGTSTYSGGTFFNGGTLDIAALDAAGINTIKFGTGGEILKIENAALSTRNFGNTIDNFSAGDLIDLAGLAFVNGAKAAYNSHTHALTVTSGGVTDTLDLAAPSANDFAAISDGAGGTRNSVSIVAPNGKGAVLDGSVGNVVLTAGNGHGNILIGGPNDTLNGATSGNDTFVFMGDFGHNTVNNYIGKANGNYDVIQLDKSEFGTNAAALADDAQQVGSNTVITNPLTPADTITLIGVQFSSLHFDASHFMLV